MRNSAGHRQTRWLDTADAGHLELPSVCPRSGVAGNLCFVLSTSIAPYEITRFSLHETCG